MRVDQPQVEDVDLLAEAEPLLPAIFLEVFRLHAQRLAGGMEYAAEQMDILLPAGI
jgi:hypothetical protein